MRADLMRHRPPDQSKEQWLQTWESSGYILEPLAKVLEGLIAADSPKRTDFTEAGAIGLLAWDAARRAAFQEVLDMLPDSAKPDRLPPRRRRPAPATEAA